MLLSVVSQALTHDRLRATAVPNESYIPITHKIVRPLSRRGLESMVIERSNHVSIHIYSRNPDSHKEYANSHKTRHFRDTITMVVALKTHSAIYCNKNVF